MKFFTLFIASVLLFIGLSYAGKAVFGMDDGMMMGDLECLNHCIDASMFPVVPSSALPVLLFVVFAITFVMIDTDGSRPAPLITLRRMTEPIRLFYRTKILSCVIIRD